ncbi:MAG: hypothetical protein KGL39_24180 [Patescibacteria group bacterium]|nr:hypothetical protein [Patescibacteria group bacterium]
MSGSRARKPVAGLDEMTTEEETLLRQMADDDAAEPMEPEANDPAVQEDEADPTEEATKPDKASPDRPADKKLVDKRALDEERNRRKTLQAELEKERRDRAASEAKIQARFDMLAQAVEASAKRPPPAMPAEEAIPDFDKDPRANIDGRFGKLERMLEKALSTTKAVETSAATLTQEQQNQRALQDLTAWGDAQEREFMRSTPDYAQAVAFLRDARARHFEALGFDAAEIEANIRQDVINTAAFTRQRGRNFGEALYKLAEASGYRKTAPTAANGPAARAAPENAAERLIRGQEMATTLGSTGGAPRGETPVNTIANMSESEFESFYNKVKANGPAAMRAVFGG